VSSRHVSLTTPESLNKVMLERRTSPMVTIPADPNASPRMS
jgi:hypothetical protein